MQQKSNQLINVLNSVLEKNGANLLITVKIINLIAINNAGFMTYMKVKELNFIQVEHLPEKLIIMNLL